MIYDEYEKSRFATWTWISSFCVLPERTFAFRHACCCCWLTDAWKRASTVIRAPFIRLIHTQCSSIIVVRFDSICLSCNQQKKDTTKRSNRKNYSDSNSSKRKRFLFILLTHQSPPVVHRRYFHWFLSFSVGHLQIIISGKRTIRQHPTARPSTPRTLQQSLCPQPGTGQMKTEIDVAFLRFLSFTAVSVFIARISLVLDRRSIARNIDVDYIPSVCTDLLPSQFAEQKFMAIKLSERTHNKKKTVTQQRKISDYEFVINLPVARVHRPCHSIRPIHFQHRSYRLSRCSAHLVANCFGSETNHQNERQKR